VIVRGPSDPIALGNAAQPHAASRSPHVERTLAWFGQFRRLAIRYERRADIHLAFLTLASALITWRFVQRWFC
jgi:hypothetical protein